MTEIQSQPFSTLCKKRVYAVRNKKKTYAANSDKEIIIEMRNADNSRFRSDLDHHAVVEIYWICTIYTLARYITYFRN